MQSASGNEWGNGQLQCLGCQQAIAALEANGLGAACHVCGSYWCKPGQARRAAGAEVCQATAEDIARIEAKLGENTALLRRLIDAMAEEEEGEEGATRGVEIVGLDGTRHVIPTADPRPVSLSTRGVGQKSKAVQP